MKLRTCLSIIVLTLLARGAQAAEPMLPVTQQVPLLLKVLTYDRTLMGSDSTTIRVGFIYDPLSPDSRRQLNDFLTELRGFADKTVRDHRVEFIPIPLDPSEEELPAEANTVMVLFVPPSDPRIVPIVRSFTRTRKLLSATPVESYVEAGLSLGLIVRNGRTGVAINMAASGEEGRVWAEDFLRLCRIID